MMGMQLQPITSNQFFDSKEVMRRLSESQRKKLMQYGADVRSLGRRSIKKAVVANKADIAAAEKAGKKPPRKKFVPSAPGEAPRSRQAGDPIKRILYGYESASEAGNIFSGNVVIGFGQLGGRKSDVPGKLERGGAVQKKGKTIRIAARPTMVPAQQKQNLKMPAMFADSL
jgi:hypothetical protein